jgi:ADP-ribose pyrophosphatase YjhB (NUDIX family)
MGHVRSECIEPITSLGVLAFHIDGYAPDDYRMLFNDLLDPECEKIRLRSGNNIETVRFGSHTDNDIVSSFRERIRFVMVSRRHSLGMIEFVRGNYDEEDPKSVKYLFRQMLSEEIAHISRSKTFKDVSSGMIDPVSRLWVTASAKFKRLLAGDDLLHNLEYYTIHIAPEFHTPEIGPPGGHRNNGELASIAAKREFREETLCEDTDFTVLTAINPIPENLIGTDKRRYRRIYHLAYMEKPVELRVDPGNDGQKHEIGNVFYCSFDSAMMLIRPRHLERKRIIAQVFMFLIGRIILLERYKIDQLANSLKPLALIDEDKDSSSSDSDNNADATQSDECKDGENNGSDSDHGNNKKTPVRAPQQANP